VTLSVLELVQLVDIFKFIVVYWVKGMNWIEMARRLQYSRFAKAEKYYYYK
jgi:hypothetical protein